MSVVVVSATLLFVAAGSAREADEPTAARKPGQAQTQDRNLELAIKSVKKRLGEDPRDEGLRYARQCLERNEQCQDMDSLDRAMESVGKNMERHPDDAGLRHAMESLENYHQRLERKHMERQRSMHRDDSGRSEKPERHV